MSKGFGFDDDDTAGFDNESNVASSSTAKLNDDMSLVLEAGGTMLGLPSVSHVCKYSRSQELTDIMREMQKYQQDDDGAAKNSIVKEDPEHKVVTDCATAVWKLEAEKTRAHRFLVDNYNNRLPELALLVPSDAVIYAKLVKLINNNVDDLSEIIESIDELIPSQISSIIIAVCSTTQGVPLSPDRLDAVGEACELIMLLEKLKQVCLEYIQLRMPLIAPNVCAFLGAALTSQIFTMCESLEKLTQMDQTELIELGAQRRDQSGIKVHTSGFLSNCDLVLIHPPEIRAKALRLIAPQVLSLARIDDNRRAADDSAGVKAREEVRMKMIRWTDPLLQRGAANNTYERLSKAARDKRTQQAKEQKEHNEIMRNFQKRDRLE
eukprot:GILI01020592.1.p1 GENE.GILI01020592.1~~GILI01020592.1.p1  ORF type:complete len:379 (-),score=54.85 GILI01020592.1:43-1179(-)